MPILSAIFTLFMNIRLIVRLTGVVPMVMVGVLVALLAKVCVLAPPGILFLIDSMSVVLVLEKRGESVICALEGWLAA